MAQYPTDPSGGVWPPPPTNATYSDQPDEGINTSGMKSTVPPEIAALKWNWGAFFLPFLWTANHKMAWGWGIFVLGLFMRLPSLLGGFFALLYFAAAVYVGLKGHTLGWQNRHFEGGFPQYIAVQKRWLAWGLAIFVLSVLVGLGQVGNNLPGAAH